MVEKERLVLIKFKSGDGIFEKYMGWMQSDEGTSVRKSFANVEKSVPGVGPDKGHILIKISIHTEEGMKEFISGNNPIAKPMYDECIENVQVWELSPVEL